jgi:hypothetical protein
MDDANNERIRMKNERDEWDDRYRQERDKNLKLQAMIPNHLAVQNCLESPGAGSIVPHIQEITHVPSGNAPTTDGFVNAVPHGIHVTGSKYNTQRPGQVPGAIQPSENVVVDSATGVVGSAAAGVVEGGLGSLTDASGLNDTSTWRVDHEGNYGPPAPKNGTDSRVLDSRKRGFSDENVGGQRKSARLAVQGNAMQLRD